MKISPKRSFAVSARMSAAVAAQSAYTPGEQPQGGGWIKLNTNENPYPPSPLVVAAIQRELGGDGASLRLYPSPKSAPLRLAAARFHGTNVENVIVGNGSDDVLNLLARTFSDASRPVGMLDPSYSLYPVLSGLCAASVRRVPVSIEGDFDADAVAGCAANIFFLTNPNAPLGTAFSREKIESVLARFDGLLVVDEAYAPFANADTTGLLSEYPNLVITRTFSKAYALAGMRVGYALASAEVIAALDRVRDSYNLDRLAQVAGAAALEDTAYYERTIATIKATREATAAALQGRGWRVLPSQANFLMVSPPSERSISSAPAAAALFQFLKENKVLTRHFPQNPLTAPFLRVSIGNDAEMAVFLDIADKWVAAGGAAQLASVS
ncbi:MAG: histidinol-phosphate transaminase [Puniceicoccales bacterium]|nr:histidinol-phosphate transaminase [Puniceicoccales bacterium]